MSVLVYGVAYGWERGYDPIGSRRDYPEGTTTKLNHCANVRNQYTDTAAARRTTEAGRAE